MKALTLVVILFLAFPICAFDKMPNISAMMHDAQRYCAPQLTYQYYRNCCTDADAIADGGYCTECYFRLFNECVGAYIENKLKDWKKRSIK